MEKCCRRLEEIYKFNRFLTNRLEESFPATPIVGTLGNNDVSPHNFMEPNTVLTAEFSESVLFTILRFELLEFLG